MVFSSPTKRLKCDEKISKTCFPKISCPKFIHPKFLASIYEIPLEEKCFVQQHRINCSNFARPLYPQIFFLFLQDSKELLDV